MIRAVSSSILTSNQYEAIEFLLKKGATPNVKGNGLLYHNETTPLHEVMFFSSFIFGKESKDAVLRDVPIYARLIIESLLRYGAHVSAQDGSGRTPLHIAAQNNNIVGAKILIEAGAKIMPKDNRGKTPVDYAESGEMIKLLKDHGAQEE